MSPLPASIERTSRLLSPWFCEVQVLPSSTDLKNPAACVPAYTVDGCCGSKRSTQAPSTPAMAGVQLAPESVLRRTPRPWVAIRRVDGCAGAAASDQTGRSGMPGCCAPIDDQRESAPEAEAAAMSNPATSGMGVSRTVWRGSLTWVPEKPG